MEIWKEIKGFEGRYKISNKGNVFSVKANKGLQPFDNKGYLRVKLYSPDNIVKKLIHVLVAEHFISEKPFEGAQVNHKDLNRKNNDESNLEWCDGSTNVKHCVENLNKRNEYLKQSMSLIGKEFGVLGIEASKKAIRQIDVETGATIAVFESAREAARHTGANYRNISQVCKGDKKTHRGFKWVFADEEGVTTIRKE